MSKAHKYDAKLKRAWEEDVAPAEAVPVVEDITLDFDTLKRLIEHAKSQGWI